MALLDVIFPTDGVTPHGYCLLWDPGLIWLHLVADASIALAYLAIPAALAVVGRHRPDMNPFGVLYWFAAFIILCAATHVSTIVTLWLPWYVLSGFVKIVCAVVSVVTAALVWRILRLVLAAPSQTEMTAANDELRRLNSELEQRVADRTSELSSANTRLIAAVYEAREAERVKADFMARMSHELRTPLNAIIGFGEMLSAGIGGTLVGKQREYCASIQAASAQLLEQITDILDLERLSEGADALDLEEQDLVTVCTDVVARLQSTVRASDVSVVSEVPAGMRVWADRRSLATILSSLVSNAVKYSPRGTSVLIRAEHVADGALIRIIDRGYGVSASNLSRIFEPFYRAHERELPAVGGSGLGLTLVRMLVNAHGGRLDFESRLNEGTTVTVWLPDEGVVRSKPQTEVLELQRPSGLSTGPAMS
jgi:signal transduction histidine kinase